METHSPNARAVLIVRADMAFINGKYFGGEEEIGTVTEKKAVFHSRCEFSKFRDMGRDINSYSL